MIASHGPFQTACDLRGTETFLMDMAMQPEFASTLLDKVTTAMEGLLKLAMQAGGKYFDLIGLPGDDYAGNLNLLISPAMFRTFIKPCLARLVNVVKEHNPNTKVMLHSDGAITKLLPDIIALGVDVIHPLEPLPAMDIPAIKKQFGNQVSFLGGYVAIKVLPRHMVTSEEFVNRFRREAKLLAQLQHPHILPVFDYGEAEGYPYIVMPYVNSGTLAGLLQNRRLSISEIRRIITQLGDALSYAHSLGMIHRDIKPSNVLIHERGNCLLTDFGLARMAEASIKITTSGTVMGTPAYMSPEQGASSTIDHRM